MTDYNWLFSISDVARNFSDVTCMNEILSTIDPETPPPLCGIICDDLDLYCKTLDYWGVPPDKLPNNFIHFWFHTKPSARPYARSYRANLDHLSYIYVKSCVWPQSIVESLCLTDDDRILAFAWNRCEFSRPIYKCLRICFEYGSVRCFRYLDTNGYLAAYKISYLQQHSDTDDLANIAARYGHAEMLEWAIKKGFRLDLAAAMRSYNDGPEVLRWLKNNYKFVAADFGIDTCQAAARCGSVEWMEWLVANGCLVDESVFAAAAGDGHFDLMKHMRANANTYPWDHTTFESAACFGNVEILQWLQDQGCPWTNSVFIGVMAGEQLPALKFLMDGGFQITL